MATPLRWVEGSRGGGNTDRSALRFRALVEEGATVDRRYRLGRTLGAGAMGTVFRAEHLLTGQAVALKILSEDKWRNDEAAQQRFLREVRLSAAVEHENVVKVTDAGHDESLQVLYIAMELLAGEDLETRLKQPTTRRKAIGWIREALSALVTAHAAGIVHRDLKPSNLFLALGEDGIERVKLLDFGIARHPGVSDVTQEGVVVGTPHYMSPEQALRPAEVDHRADLWSVGVMLYEIVTGALPFEDESVHGLVMRAALEPHAPLSSRAQGIDARLSSVIDRCLAKEPDQRPADAEEVASVLDLVVADKNAAWLDRRIGLSSDAPPTRSLDEVASEARASYRSVPEGRSVPPTSVDSPLGVRTDKARSNGAPPDSRPPRAGLAVGRAPSLNVEMEDGRPDAPRAPWTAIVFGLVGALVVGGWWFSRSAEDRPVGEEAGSQTAADVGSAAARGPQPATPGSVSRDGHGDSARQRIRGGVASPPSPAGAGSAVGASRTSMRTGADERAEVAVTRRRSSESRMRSARTTTTRPRRAPPPVSTADDEGAGRVVEADDAEVVSDPSEAAADSLPGASGEAVNEEVEQAPDPPGDEAADVEVEPQEEPEVEPPAPDEPVDPPPLLPTPDEGPTSPEDE